MGDKKLSDIALAPFNLQAGDYLVGVAAGNIDQKFSYAQVGSFLVAASNLTFSVPSQYLTIQAAVNAAAGYNYQNLYYPTINVSNGTYSNATVILPPLINSPAAVAGTLAGQAAIVGNVTTPTNVKLADNGTDYTIRVMPGATWSVSGIQFTGTQGGFDVYPNGALTIDKIDWGGALVGTGLDVQPGGACFAGGTLTTSASTMGIWLYSRGKVVLDAGNLSVNHAITFSSFFIGVDFAGSGVAASGWTVTNGSNVTATISGLQMNNAALFEADSTTKVDGSVLTRATFPGGVATNGIDGSCYFEPDFNGIVLLRDLAGTSFADYNKTNAGGWTFSGTAATIDIAGTASIDPTLTFDDTPKSGVAWRIFCASNLIGTINASSGNFEGPWASKVGEFRLAGSAVLSWSTDATKAYNATADAGLSRLNPAVVAVGNATAGDFSGTLVAFNIYSQNAAAIGNSGTTITGGGTSNTPTLTSGPANGNPTKWLPYNDNGTTRYIPSW